MAQRRLQVVWPANAEPEPPADPCLPPAGRRLYLKLLTWAFTLFNTVRVAAYLPTMWAIHSSGDSSQHSLWTWVTWLGANATMAAWLHEHNGQRIFSDCWEWRFTEYTHRFVWCCYAIAWAIKQYDAAKATAN